MLRLLTCAGALLLLVSIAVAEAASGYEVFAADMVWQAPTVGHLNEGG